MYHKVLFSSSAHGTTAGIVVDAQRIDVNDVVAVSRLYPAFEALRMRRYHVSPAFATWAEAFAYVFPIDIMGNSRTSAQS